MTKELSEKAWNNMYDFCTPLTPTKQKKTK